MTHEDTQIIPIERPRYINFTKIKSATNEHVSSTCNHPTIFQQKITLKRCTSLPMFKSLEDKVID